MATLLLALLAALAPADSLAAHGRWFFNHRHLDAAWLDSAAAIAGRARALDQLNAAAVALDCDARMARAEQAGSRADRLALYRATQALADSMRSARPESPVGHFFWATASAQIGLIQRNLAALQAMPAVRRAYAGALAADPRHVGALFGSAMMLAGTPRFAGGSIEKADSLLRLAIGIDSNLTMLRVERARLLVRAKRRAEARVELQRVLDAKNPSVPASYWLKDRSDAEQLLRQLGDAK